jgi:hypothetical protein
VNRDPITICGKEFVYDSRTRTHRPAEAVDNDNDSGQAADMELPASRQSVAACKGAAFDSRVSITIVSYRSRLADADGISAKAAIDGLVMCGILADDTTKEISEVRYRQVKVKNEADEKTEIVITEV